jgi:hypothetical protein
MISLTVTGHAEPEQSREEIARLLKEYGVGAVCLLRNGSVAKVCDISVSEQYPYDLGNVFGGWHSENGVDPTDRHRIVNHADIIRVFPPGTRLRVTVEVVE